MPKTCPSCRFDNADGAKFCNECGHKFTAAADSGRVAGLTTRVIQRPDARPETRGERRVVSVLFADIKDYTTLSERLDPEQIEDLVGGLFREFSEVITQQGGYVDKFMGDAILALFGAPKSYGDDTDRAVNCALEMQRRAKAANAGRDVQLDVRIGIDTGEVVVGNLGQRGEYTAIGDPVNTANRVQTAAEPGSVYISETTAQLVRSRFRLAALPPRALKGKAEPVVLHRVEGAARATEGYIGPFIGRRRELDLLLASFTESVRESRPRFVLVRAEAGMGKSRLYYEFRRRLKAMSQPSRRVSASFQPAGLEPLHGMRALARDLLGLKPGATEAEVSEQIELASSVLPGGVPDAGRGHLAYLLGHQLGNLERTGLEAKQRLEGAHLVLKQLIEQTAERSPVLLVFEDVHWIDPDSLQFLRSLARGTFKGPVFVLALGRPESVELVREMLGDPFENIELRPLEQTESAAVCSGVLGGPVDDKLAALVNERAGGNPFVMEELAKGLKEGGLLELTQGRWRLAPGRGESTIPVGVRSIIAARIDALEAADRAVLNALSVLGREFRRGAAEVIGGPGTPEALQRLVQRGLLVELGDDRGQARYMFCHALLQEVAYSGLLKRDKLQLHRAMADYYEAQLADNQRDPRRTARLAMHLSAAGLDERAAGYYFEAGRDAAAQWMAAFAVEKLTAALQCLKAAPAAIVDGKSGTAARLTVTRHLAQALNHSGRIAEALQLASTGITDADAYPREAAELLDICAAVASRLSKLEDSLRYAEHAAALWQGAGQRESAARSELAAIAALVQLGRHDQARDRLPAATPAEADDPAWQIEYLRVVSSFHAEQGRLKDALAHETRRVEVARRAGNRRMVAGALANIAMYSSDLGEFGDARALLEEALAEYRRAGDLFNVSVVLTNYGNLLRRIGSVDESIKAQSEARELASALGDDYGVLVSGINIAACHMSLAQYTRAAVEHERALALLRRFKDLPAEAQLRHNTAIVAFRMGDFRNAREQLEQSTALNQRRNNIRGLVQNEQLQAEDLFRTGDLPRAWDAFASCIARAAAAGLPRAVSSALQALAQCALIARDRAQWAGALAQTLAASDPDRDQRASRMLQAIDVLLGDPSRFAELASLVDPNDQSRDGQLLLAAAVLACVWVADMLPAQEAATAGTWARAVTSFMQQGGRADTEYAALLHAQARLQARAGQVSEAALREAQREANQAAERVESTWLLQSKA